MAPQRLIIEIDHLQGAAGDTGWTATLAGALAQLSLDARVTVGANAIVPDGPVTTHSDLHRAMNRALDSDLRAGARQAGAWYLHLLVVPSHPANFLGLMFDFDLDDIQREGCALFAGPIDELAAGHDGLSSLLRSRTALHEIGHVLNLIHPNASSTGVDLMVQTGRLQQQEAAWPGNIRLDYSTTDVQFLRNNPQTCQPGTPVRFRGADAADEVQTVGASPLQVHLRLPTGVRRDRVILGKPLEVALDVENRGDAPLEIPVSASIESRTVILEVEDMGNGARRRLCPPVVACGGRQSTRQLRAGETATWTEWIHFDRNGFVFPHSGEYVLHAHVAGAGDPPEWFAAEPLPIRVIRARAVDAETADRLLDPEVGRYLYLGGAGHLKRAHRKVQTLLAALEPGPIAATLQANVARVTRRSGERTVTASTARRKLREAAAGLHCALKQESSRIARGRWASELGEILGTLRWRAEAEAVRREFENDLEVYYNLQGDSRRVSR
jgi:hypothetical protein